MNIDNSDLLVSLAMLLLLAGLLIGFFMLDGWQYYLLLLGYPIATLAVPAYFRWLDMRSPERDDGIAFVSSMIFQQFLAPWVVALLIMGVVRGIQMLLSLVGD